MTIPLQFLPEIQKALEHYAAYMHATNRDPVPYRAIADHLVRSQNAPSGKQKQKASNAKKASAPLPPHLQGNRVWRIRLELPD